MLVQARSKKKCVAGPVAGSEGDVGEAEHPDGFCFAWPSQICSHSHSAPHAFHRAVLVGRGNEEAAVSFMLSCRDA